MIIINDRVRPLAKCPLWRAELRLRYTEWPHVALAPRGARVRPDESVRESVRRKRAWPAGKASEARREAEALMDEKEDGHFSPFILAMALAGFFCGDGERA